MKRIFLTLILILTAIFLVSCKGNREIIDVKITNEEHASNSLNFTLIINDLDGHLEGKIKLELTDLKGTKKGTMKPDTIELGEVEKEISITGLDIDTQYTFKVLGTIKGKSRTLLTRLFTTKDNKKYDIRTPQDFLNIKKDTYGTYTLLNDIDFSEIELTKEDLMPTFYGTLNGQGYTVKNMAVDFSTSPLYKGIFEQNNRDSVIKNIKFDNIQFGSEDAPLSKNGTQYIGILVGSTSTTSTIDNVTITNSKIYYESKSTSTSHSVGVLVGRNQGVVKNIILENNELNYTASKTKTLNIGGAIGLSRTSTASVRDVFVNSDVNVDLDIEDHSVDNITVHVGGAIGFVEDPSRTSPATQIISKSNIVVNDLGIKAKEIDEDADDQTIRYNLHIGGVIGGFTNSAIKKVLFDGSITINHEEKEQIPADGKKLANVIVNYNVGGIVGFYSTTYEIFNSIVKSTDIDVTSTNQTLFRVGDVFGRKSAPTVVDEIRFMDDFDTEALFHEALEELFASKIVDKYLE